MIEPMDKVQTLLDSIDDPQLKERLHGLLSGKIEKLVKCNSKTCKGRVIAHIMDNNEVHETPPVEDKKGKYGLYSSGLEGHRSRFDGQLGFRCYCGNSTIAAEAEQGIIGPHAPSRSDIEKIADNLSKKPSKEEKAFEIVGAV